MDPVRQCPFLSGWWQAIAPSLLICLTSHALASDDFGGPFTMLWLKLWLKLLFAGTPLLGLLAASCLAQIQPSETTLTKITPSKTTPSKTTILPQVGVPQVGVPQVGVPLAAAETIATSETIVAPQSEADPLPPAEAVPPSDGDSTLSPSLAPTPDPTPEPAPDLNPELSVPQPSPPEMEPGEAEAAPALVAAAQQYPTFNNQQLDEQIPRYLNYLKENGPPYILIVGSSRARQGLDPIALQRSLARRGYGSIQIFSFTVNGATAQVVELKLRRILTPDQLPKLIVWADGVRALNSGRPDRTQARILESPGYRLLVAGQRPCLSSQGRLVRQANCPTTIATKAEATTTVPLLNWESILPNQAAASASPASNRRWCRQLRGPCPPAPASPGAGAADGSIDLNTARALGFHPVVTQFNPATYFQSFPRIAGQYDGDYQNFSISGVQAKALQNVINFVQSRGIPLVFVNLPMTDIYLDAVRSRRETQFRTYMQRLARQEQFAFHDFGQRWPRRYDFFMDPSHLNHTGAIAVGQQLGQEFVREGLESLRSR